MVSAGNAFSRYAFSISSNAGGLLRWPIKIFLPIGFALLSLQGFSELIKRVAMLTGHMKPDLHYERPLQ